MKNYFLLLLIMVFSALISCQRDIPLLGEGATTPKSEVFIKSISFSNFPVVDPSNMLPWDNGSDTLAFDTLDYMGPDIYFYLYYKGDVDSAMTFQQPTHFTDVLPLGADSPLVYYFTEPFQIRHEYIDTTFYLTMRDLDFTQDDTTSTYMDSIPFAIGPDKSHPDNPYITSISGTGYNGSQVTLGLVWK